MMVGLISWVRNDNKERFAAVECKAFDQLTDKDIER